MSCDRPTPFGPWVPAALATLAMGAVWAQSEPEPRDERPPVSAEGLEEITVRGEQSLGSLRSDVQAAREQVYDLFNSSGRALR